MVEKCREALTAPEHADFLKDDWERLQQEVEDVPMKKRRRKKPAAKAAESKLTAGKATAKAKAEEDQEDLRQTAASAGVTRAEDLAGEDPAVTFVHEDAQALLDALRLAPPAERARWRSLGCRVRPQGAQFDWHHLHPEVLGLPDLISAAAWCRPAHDRDSSMNSHPFTVVGW